jgi:hypothetical protein
VRLVVLSTSKVDQNRKWFLSRDIVPPPLHSSVPSVFFMAESAPE